MNAIYNKASGDQLEIKNTGLMVLSDVLALAGSDLAKDDAQCDLIIALLYDMDQSMVGTGGSYIDVRKLPWGGDFSAQQAFLLAALTKASEKYRWSELKYEPNADTALENISDFKRVISSLKQSEIIPKEYGKMDAYIRCPKHDVFEHIYGCVICHNNDES